MAMQAAVPHVDLHQCNRRRSRKTEGSIKETGTIEGNYVRLDGLEKARRMPFPFQDL